MKWISIIILLFIAEGSAVQAQYLFPMLRARPTLQASRNVVPRTMSILGSQDSSMLSIFPNIDVTNDPSDDQNEPSISVNPLNPLAIAIGEVDDRNYNVLWSCITTNGGVTWKNNSMPQGYFHNGSEAFENATDPGVVFDQSGSLFFSNVFYQLGSANEEACYRSPDNGQSWQSPVYVAGDTNALDASEADRDYITVDRDSLSPFFGRVYITWVTIAYPKSVIVESHSTDHGASWSMPVTVSSAPATQDTVLFQGPVPACGPSGQLYIAFEDRDSTSKRILVAISVDGGASFTPQVLVGSYRELGNVVPDNFNGHPAIKGKVETNSFPSIAVDLDYPGSVGFLARPHGRVYVTWCGRDTDSNAHVFLSISNDSGRTWATPKFIDNDSSIVKTDKCFPWIAVDQSNGDVGVTFYDSRNDPDSNILVDDYLSLSTDGGQTFTARRISSTSSDPRICRDVVSVDTVNFLFFGDYISLDAMDSMWYPTWTDTRSGFDQDIYMAAVQPYMPMPVTDLSVQDSTINGKPAAIISWNYLPETTFGYPLSVGYHFDVAKDGSMVAVQSESMLQFIDTNVNQGHEYQVTVLSGNVHSVTDSVSNIQSGVADQIEQNSSIRFTNEPATIGREDNIIIDRGEACSVWLTFYDELGRAVGTPVSDGIVAAHHELGFMPEAVGVKFFVLKESSFSGANEVVGKISVIGP